MHGFFLAFALDGTTLAVLAAVGIAVLGFVYFGIRFWIVSTRPANIRDVPTPNLDRLNQQALERLGNVTLEEDEEETVRALQEGRGSGSAVEIDHPTGYAAIYQWPTLTGPSPTNAAPGTKLSPRKL